MCVTFLARVVLALMALGAQLPVALAVPLCLCEALPIFCPADGACARGSERPPSCCAPAPAEPRSDVGSAQEAPTSCCGCELHVGGEGAAPLAPAPTQHGALAALPPDCGASCAPPALARALPEPAARPPDRASAAFNRPLRI